MEASNLSQAGSQAGSHLPPGEGSSLAAGSQTSQAAGRLVTPLSSKEGDSPVAPQAPQAGTNLPPAVKVPGQTGNILGTQLGKGPSRLPRGTTLPPRQTELVPGTATPHLTPLIGSLKGLPQKTLTLSGSLTYPTNLWQQHKCLFWLKDPTLW